MNFLLKILFAGLFNVMCMMESSKAQKNVCLLLNIEELSKIIIRLNSHKSVIVH